MRILRRLLLIGLVLLVLLAFAASMFFDSGIKAAVEKGVTYALAVPSTAGSVKLHPFAGSVGLEKLSIANPAGFSGNPFLDLDRAAVSVHMSSLMSDEVQVQLIELTGIHLRLEGRGAKPNYGVILDNLKRFDAGKKKGEEPGSDEQGSQKRFMIAELTIRDVKVDTDYALDPALGKVGTTAASMTLPEIRMKDVGNGKSLTISELTQKILQALLQAASEGNLPSFSGDIGKDLRDSLSGIKDLGKDAEGALEGVKDLFKKKG